IIEDSRSRWRLDTIYQDGVFRTSLVVRSIEGVTPEGVGIARTREKSEDGSILQLFFEKGNQLSNIQNFTIRQNISAMATRTILAYKIGEETRYSKQSDGLSKGIQGLLGRYENFVSDYRIDSDDTA